jgi:hypothetical protein
LGYHIGLIARDFLTADVKAFNQQLHLSRPPTFVVGFSGLLKAAGAKTESIVF